MIKTKLTTTFTFTLLLFLCGYSMPLMAATTDYPSEATDNIDDEGRRDGFIVSNTTYIEENGFYKVTIEVFKEGRIDYKLTSIKGVILHRDTKRLNPGPNQFKIPMKDYSQGIYLLEMQMEVEQQTMVIEKNGRNEIKTNPIKK